MIKMDERHCNFEYLLLFFCEIVEDESSISSLPDTVMIHCEILPCTGKATKKWILHCEYNQTCSMYPQLYRKLLAGKG